jgi:hypothetical protein
MIIKNHLVTQKEKDRKWLKLFCILFLQVF